MFDIVQYYCVNVCVIKMDTDRLGWKLHNVIISNIISGFLGYDFKALFARLTGYCYH
jgi:hypothetical protein